MHVDAKIDSPNEAVPLSLIINNVKKNFELYGA